MCAFTPARQHGVEDLSRGPVCAQHDEKGSATALLHLCVKVSEEQFLFFFACLGDTEACTRDPDHPVHSSGGQHSGACLLCIAHFAQQSP